MDFEIPQEIRDYLDELDGFIEREIRPLEQQDDNVRFFDHRRENARTDWENDGRPRADWEALLELPITEVRQRFRIPEPPDYHEVRSKGAPVLAA